MRTKALQERVQVGIDKLKIPSNVLARIDAFRLKWKTPGHMPETGTPARWAYLASRLHSLAPMYSSNEIEVYDDTGIAFKKMWDAIDNAKQTIKWATYICKDDHVGNETISRLVRAAQRGVFVQFLYDDGGNISGRDELVQPLRDEKNAQVICFHPLFRKMLRYFMSFRWQMSPGIRNHRKILIVDDTVGFTGGLNIGNEYAGKSCGGSGKFRDTMSKLSGPALQDLIAAFDEVVHCSKNTQWRPARLFRQRERIQTIIRSPREQLIRKFNEIRARQRLRRQWRRDLQDKKKQVGKLVQVLTSNAWRGTYAIQKAYHIVISHSMHRVWITTPYFIPTGRLLRAVLRAARRGVDVRILTGSIRTTDPFLMWWASQYIVHKLLKSGVKLYEFEGKNIGENGEVHRIMHAKTLVIDGVWSSIGSYNLDALSNKLLEVTLSSVDYALATEMEKQFLTDLKDSKQITEDTFNSRSFMQKAMISCAYHLGRFFEKLFFWSFSHREVSTSISKTEP